MGIHKWEPDIYIGYSRALHLQCRIKPGFDHPSVIESPLRLRALWPKYILAPPPIPLVA
jgi:hypothetical protein